MREWTRLGLDCIGGSRATGIALPAVQDPVIAVTASVPVRCHSKFRYTCTLSFVPVMAIVLMWRVLCVCGVDAPESASLGSGADMSPIRTW